MIGPLVGEKGVLGALTIINRLGEGTHFEPDDLRLLETVANQAAVALENGQLEQSLHELSLLKEQLRHQAFHDSLTGLANRPAFVEEVSCRVMAAKDPGTPIVIFLDLDDFKIVNDTLGHAAGDQLLVGVAERIGEQLRPSDLIARFGGDEFAVLPAEGSTVTDALTMARRIIAALELPFRIHETDVVVGCSAGISAAHGDQPVDELLRNADVAMYRAKAEGKRRVEVFDPTMHSSIVERHALTSDLGRSVSRGDLTRPLPAHRRPGRPAGPSASRRSSAGTTRRAARSIRPSSSTWPRRTTRSSPLAVSSCRRRPGRSWSGTASPGLERLGLSVNLSPLQLQHPGFVEEVVGEIRDSGIDPRVLTLEMTETAMFRDAQATIATLEALRQLGARIAMDDFGTGYSSLAYLRRFPVDSLKIARELIGEPGESDDGEGWAFAGRSSRSGGRSACRSSPRGSRPPNSCACCVASAAGWVRDSCSDGRRRPASWDLVWPKRRWSGRPPEGRARRAATPSGTLRIP